MPEFKVVQASKKKDVPAKEPGRKDMQVIALVLDEGGEQKSAEWFTLATTQVPAPGSTLEGTLEDGGQWGLKFKKASGGGGGWGKGKDPEDQRRIVRQHSQKCAVDLIKVAHDLGLVKPKNEGETPLERVSELANMVKQIAHNLEADVYRVEADGTKN